MKSTPETVLRLSLSSFVTKRLHPADDAQDS